MKTTARTRLIEERKRRRWSQQDVANRLGTTQHNVSRWERGQTIPGPYFRAKLGELFDKRPQELGLFVNQVSEESPLLQPDAPPISPPVSAQQAPLWHVPYNRNPFFTGREEILQQLVNELCTQPGRVRAITGLPGVGKTSLAVALAHHSQIRERFSDGVLWVSLGSAPQVAEVLNEWGTVLGTTSTETQTLTTIDALARRLHQHLRDSRMLLILDDVWQISDAQVFQLGGEQCMHVLITRSPLLAHTVAHEYVTSLPPLSEAASRQLLQRLAPYASQRYPTELQALIQPSGGLPLALTLLGRSIHVRTLHGSSRRLLQSLQQLRSDIQTRFQVAEPVSIEDSRPGFPAGTELSLRTTIDLSVQQLSLPAQRALYALAVFAPTPQSFSEEAALAICNVSVETFDTLVDSGLIELCQEERYQVHQTILDYARLQTSDPAVEERLIAFIVPFIERYREAPWVLNRDLLLITTALERAFNSRRYQPLLRGIAALQPLIEQRRLYSLAQTLLRWGHQAALALHDREELARIWLFQGKMADLCGDGQEARQAYMEGLALARELQHQELLPELLILVGATLTNTDVSEEAESYLLEGLRAIAQLEDDASLSRAFQYLGELADSHGRKVKALSLYQRGLAYARQTQNRHTASALLQNLGSQAAQRGDFMQATAYYEEGLRIARALDDRQRESALLMNMGMLAWYEQRPDEAVKLSQESLKLAREIGHQMRISSVLQNLGMMMRHQGQVMLAEEYLQESLEIAQRIGHYWLICETLGEVGLLALKQKQTAKAKRILTEMQETAQTIRAPLLLGQALFGLARVAEQEGYQSKALQLTQESLAIFVHLNNRTMLQEVEAWQRTMLTENSSP